jgi:hypothetical protein
MVQRWRGIACDEGALHTGAMPDGHGFALAAQVLDGQHLAPSPEEFFARAPLWLADDRALIAKICGPVYVQRMGIRPAGRVSRHGALASPGRWGRPFHAIVLIAKTVHGFAALDPYYPADHQPVVLDDDTMLDVFACELVVI